MNESIMVVDDTPENLRLLCSILAERGYELRPVTDGATALAAVKISSPDLILLDINMPDMNGFEVCEILKADEETSDIPVIFISALNETMDKVRAFEVGGLDYINKPFHFEEVVVRVESQLNLRRQRHKIEALAEKEKHHFEELNRLKDQFVQTVSHDLKNPINVIMTYVDLLRRTGIVHDEKGLKFLDIIDTSTSRMTDLINDLLDLARIESGEAILSYEKTDINQLLYQCITDANFVAQEKGVALVSRLDDPILDLEIDPSRLTLAINNVLSNAIKYTATGGEVSIQLEQVQDEIIISIADNGLGIPKDAIPYLFDRFYRVDTPVHSGIEGTGLGLSIAQTIMEAHHGQITVESELGVGSTFRLVLPLIQATGVV